MAFGRRYAKKAPIFGVLASWVLAAGGALTSIAVGFEKGSGLLPAAAAAVALSGAYAGKAIGRVYFLARRSRAAAEAEAAAGAGAAAVPAALLVSGLAAGATGLAFSVLEGDGALGVWCVALLGIWGALLSMRQRRQAAAAKGGATAAPAAADGPAGETGDQSGGRRRWRRQKEDPDAISAFQNAPARP